MGFSPSSRTRPIFTLGAAFVVLVLGACRGIIGIDERPLLPSDGGADGAGEGSLGPSFCASLSPQAEFCSDFDDGALTGWANEGKTPNPGESGGGKMSLDGARPHSAPYALSTLLPPLVGTQSSAAATLQKFLPGNAARITLGFELFIESEEFPLAQGGFVNLASIAFDDLGGVLLYRSSTGTYFGVVPSGERLKVPVPVAVGAWKSVKMVLRNTPVDGGADGEAYLAIDGSLAVTVRLPASFQGRRIVPRVTLGPAGQGPMGAFRASLDDVTFYYGE
jgi:hypothetical protein